jgi:alpha-galactosidase
VSAPAATADYARLDAAGVTLLLAQAPHAPPRLLHFGAALPGDLDPRDLEAALAPSRRGSTPDTPAPPSLLPTLGFGDFAEPALVICREGGDGALYWDAVALAQEDGALVARLRDERLGVAVRLSWRLDESGLMLADAEVENVGDQPLSLHTLAALALPLPGWAREILSFGGDWGREGQPHRFAAPFGVWSKTERTGRTGFAGATCAMVAADAGDETGQAIGLHLGWSGDHRLLVETASDGARQAQLGALLAPGEIVLAPGARHRTPTAYAAYSGVGLNGVASRFHAFARARLLSPPTPRKVHFNSWEGVYFDVDEAKLIALAESAAAIGAERFVVDDGWFVGRRDDTTSLGDWRVDPERFPHGLAPLIGQVHALGMDFGLWVEPEMVSPESALYRAHPDWALAIPGRPRPTMRHQLHLDLTRAEVRDHVFAALDGLLSAHPIAYLKWDCNRFVFPAMSEGRAAGQAMTAGFYALLDRVRAAHPSVEIESCASGGGRIDFSVLSRCARVWPSDATDALERLRIQRWAGLLLPPEALGAHVGPSPNPMTGRRLSMTLRGQVALFGHMGVELDPRRLEPADRETLAAQIALYKRFRGLIHSGRMRFWTTPEGADGRIVVAADGAEALALVVNPAATAASDSPPTALPGLDPAARYFVRLLPPWPQPAGRRLADTSTWRSGREVSGANLAGPGLRLPLSDPETGWLLHLARL